MRIVINEDIKKAYLKWYWKATRRTLVKCRQEIIDKVEYIDLDRLKEYIGSLLNPAPMKDNVLDIWSKVGGKFANDTSKRIFLKSSVIDLEIKADQLKIWQERMKAYAYERSLQKVQAIMDTQQELINTVIDKVINRINDEGLSIQAGHDLMKNSLSDETMTELENYQAERIARTEVNGASNTGSFEAAKDSGIDMKKIWIHSGNLGKGYRENHVTFSEMESQEMDYEYEPGLEFPGDENADPGEIINCRCTVGWDVD